MLFSQDKDISEKMVVALVFPRCVSTLNERKARPSNEHVMDTASKERWSTLSDFVFVFLLFLVNYAFVFVFVLTFVFVLLFVFVSLSCFCVAFCFCF